MSAIEDQTLEGPGTFEVRVVAVENPNPDNLREEIVRIVDAFVVELLPNEHPRVSLQRVSLS